MSTGAKKPDPNDPMQLALEYVGALRKLSEVNQQIRSLSHVMMAHSIKLASSNVPFDTMFKNRVARLSVIFQVMAVEAIRTQVDLDTSLEEIDSLQGKLVKPAIEIVKH